jgi:aspartate/methionine/tyrosine aminotransferase
MSSSSGFVPPPYPYDRLDAFSALGRAFDGGVIDLSIGTPCDPPLAAVVAALSSSNSERGYPASIGSDALRKAASAWMSRRFAIEISPNDIAACIGTKEFVGTTPQYMRLRTPDKDTVFYPAVAYPTYEMGAILANCRAVAVPMNADGTMNLSAISSNDIQRGLMLWVNSPSNPTGSLDDMGAAVRWGRANGIPVFSDECYAEFTWSTAPQSALQHGVEGVVSVHSLSKRSNLAGVRVGFYAGDPDIVNYLKEVRKHVGMMVPGPAQAAGVAALFVPFPFAVDDHQTANAKFLTDVGAGWVLQQKDMTAAGVAQWLSVRTREELSAVAQRARTQAQPYAAQRIADICEELAGGNA